MEVRILIHKDGKNEEVERTISNHIPRVGDFFCFMQYELEVFQVVWYTDTRKNRRSVFVAKVFLDGSLLEDPLESYI